MALDLTFEGTSRTVQTRTWKIHYNEAGPADGVPILMLHGSGPGATGWSNFGPNMRTLGEKYRVIAADMPGWGPSDAVTIEERDHVQAALDLLDALEIEKAAFVGNSMGGATSIRFAAIHHDRISHLITMGSGGIPGPKLFSAGDGPSEGLKVLQKGYRDPSPETMLELVSIMTFDPKMADPAIAQMRSETARSRPDHLKNFLDGIGQRPAITAAQVAGITAPTLLFHGRDDRVVHYEHSLELVATIPNSRLVLFNRCGHWAQLEHADEFNRLVDDFIANN